VATTLSLTTTPTTIDPGANSAVWIKNTGATRVTIYNGAERVKIKPGRDRNFVVAGTITASMDPLDGSSGTIGYDLTPANSAMSEGPLVRTPDIAAGAVTAEKLANDVPAAIAASTALTGTFVGLPSGGAVGQVPVVSATGAPPTMAWGSGGGGVSKSFVVGLSIALGG